MTLLKKFQEFHQEVFPVINVSEDLNNDDIGDNPLAGVVLGLLDANGTTIATTATDANGDYLFGDLDAGNYTVKEIQPSGYILSLIHI